MQIVTLVSNKNQHYNLPPYGFQPVAIQEDKITHRRNALWNSLTLSSSVPVQQACFVRHRQDNADCVFYCSITARRLAGKY